MNLEITVLSEVRWKKTNTISLICGIYKRDINELIYETERDSQTYITNSWLPKGEGINWEFGANRYTLLYIE